MRKKIISAAAAALLLTGCSSGSAGGGAPESSLTSDSESASASEGSSSGEAQSAETSGNGYTPGERDENGVYVAEGYAARLEYPLNEKSIEYAAKRFGYIYEEYLAENGGGVFVSVIPDKNYFLAEKNGYPALDYSEFAERLTEKMDYAEYINIFPMLELSDYYRTDTHWRQEKITDIAAYIAGKMGVTLSAEYSEATLDAPFYGVHCRQAELDIEPDELIYLDSPAFSEYRVLDGETNSYIDLYNMELAHGDDPYEIFLSGAKSLMTIENPNAPAEKQLVIFRDSFAGSIAPLLAEGYSKITLVDIRYLSPTLLDRFVTFSGQDALFLYSVPVLNNSETIK